MAAPIVIVGAGQAAASLIARHVALESSQPLLLLGEESHPPYQRPPLSKKYLLGQLERERLFIRPRDWYADNGIEIRYDTRVDEIRPDAGEVVTAAGESIAYDKLVLCTGAHARALPGSLGGDLDGVHRVRTIDDIDRITPEFRAGRKLLIVGGGYIGLEAAASARTLGLEVCVIEMTERIMQRVAAAETSDYFRQLHSSHGVDLREATALKKLHAANGRVSAAEFDSGERIDVDLVLVGIGAAPNVDLAAAAGLDCDNGIAVDAQCRTSDANIYAAGDCASFVRNGARVRLESVQNAADQGDLVARVLAGEDATYDALPWFWSDQYDCRLQIVGLNQGFDRTVRRATDERCVSIWYYADARLLAIDAMNDPKAYAFGRIIIEAGKHPPAEQIADPATDLKAIAKS